MSRVVSLLPVLAIAVPSVAVIPILLSRQRPTLREGWTAAATLLTVAIVGVIVRGVLAGSTYVAPAVPFIPGAPLALRVDALGALFGLIAAGLWVVASLYSVGYARSLDLPRQTRFFAAFSASVGAALGVAFAGNLITLFVFYELLTIATYPLVVHGGTEAARAAGRQYVRYTLTGGVAVLAGIVLLQALVGTTAFTPGGIPAVLTADPVLARVAFGLLVLGFGVKAALMPFHGWLPGAMVAPTPVSGLLHAVAVVKSGVFGIARIVLSVYGPAGVTELDVGVPLAVLAAASMLFAALLALHQTGLKRGLAYSTVSQLAYIVMGLALLTPGALKGALLHLSAHALMKIALFFAAGVIYVETHVERLDDLAGIGRRLPATMTLFAVASAGLVGLPLVAGFVSKWYLLTGLVGGWRFPFAVALLAAGLLKLLFFWPIILDAFFRGPGNREEQSAGTVAMDGGGHDRRRFERRSWRTETDWRLLLPVLVAVAIAVLYGVLPTSLPFFELAARVVEVSTG